MASSPFMNEWEDFPTKLFGGARASCAHTKVGEELFFIGGMDEKGNTLSSVVSLNLGTKQWTQHPPLPQPRRECAAAGLDDHRLVVVGGLRRNSKSALLYDTLFAAAWTPLPDLKIGRESPCCVSNNDRVYVIGGWDPSGETHQDTVEELNLEDGRRAEWKFLDQRLTTGRKGCAAVWDPIGGNILVTGGRNHQCVGTCEILHPSSAATTTTTVLPPMRVPRSFHTLVLVANGRYLVAMGGKDSASGRLCTVEAIRLAGNRRDEQHALVWTSLPSMMAPRSSLAAFAVSGQDGIVVAGGWDGAKVLDSMEVILVDEEQLLLLQGAPSRDLASWSVAYPTPPPLPDVPGGSCNEAHKAKCRAWLETMEKQWQEFQQRRLVARRDRRAALEREIAQARKRYDEDIRAMDETDQEYFSKIYQGQAVVKQILDEGKHERQPGDSMPPGPPSDVPRVVYQKNDIGTFGGGALGSNSHLEPWSPDNASSLGMVSVQELLMRQEVESKNR